LTVCFNNKRPGFCRGSVLYIPVEFVFGELSSFCIIWRLTQIIYDETPIFYFVT
jgi:hypothetical protein